MGRNTSDHRQLETTVMGTGIENALVGTWQGNLTFTHGPRQGEQERLYFRLLPDRVIVGTDAGNGQLPPAVGEWTVKGNRFSYWLNAVVNDPGGRPTIVVYGHGEGTIEADGQAFRVSGGSEVYSGSGELLATNGAEAQATRIDAG